MKEKKENNTSNPTEEMMNSVQGKLIYIFPIMMYTFGYSLGSVVALYFIVGNIFSTFQEIYLQKKIILDHKATN